MDALIYLIDTLLNLCLLAVLLRLLMQWSRAEMKQTSSSPLSCEGPEGATPRRLLAG